ncbi:hypothetical protein JYT71_01500 [Acidimicrobiaceae bacterium AH-315-P05]|nr:hypothetical protein [Acidimicrobiaceae bacterium AH-315-P05]
MTPPDEETGAFAFRVDLFEGARSLGTAAAGQLLTGEIRSPGDSVFFDLDAAPGDRFQVIAGSTECDLSKLLVEPDDGSRNYYYDDLCEDHIIEVTSRGAVRLVIDPDGDETGPFDFRVIPARTTRIPLTFGDLVQGRIDSPGDRYIFPLVVPEEGLSMQVVATGTPCDFSNLAFSEPGARVWRYFGELCEDHIISIDSQGEYQLIVDPSGLETGRFSFRLFEIIEPTPESLQFGEEIHGELNAPGEYAVYSFTTTVDNAEFEFISGDAPCDFSNVYYRPLEGGRIRYWGDLCEDHTIRVDEAGAWAIVIDPNDASVGSYSFTLQENDS